MMTLFSLLFTIFLDSLGFGLIYPILSPLLMETQSGFLPAETSVGVRGALFGLLVSVYCLGQFFGGPILGALSDQKGRKKILLFSLLVCSVGYLIAGAGIMGGSVVLLFVGRLITGAAGGNYSIVQSIVVDRFPESKAKYFGLMGMAWGGGFILGPFIGGHLVVKEPTSLLFWAIPCFVASMMVLGNWLLVRKAIEESLPCKEKMRISLSLALHQLKEGFSHPQLKGIFLVMFVFSFGWGFFTEFMPLFLMHHFSFGVSQISNFYAYIGVCVMLCQGLLIRPLLARFSPHQLLPRALFGLALVVPLLGIFSNPLNLSWLILIVSFCDSILYPTSSTIVSDAASKESQGEMLGMNNSLQWAAIGIAPFFSGALVAKYPYLTLAVASISMFIAAGAYFRFVRRIPTSS